MAVAAIGTDTMGSVRIPAALCGLVGWKPTARRVPLDGAIPLAPSLDSIGVLATSVDGCAALDAVLAGDGPPLGAGARSDAELGPADLVLAAPRALVLDHLDAPVAAAFAAALSCLSRAGCRVSELELAELAELPTVGGRASFHIAEGYAWHRELLAARRGDYDPFIARRLASGAAISDADYRDLVRARADLIARADRASTGFDALVMPAAPIVAPRVADVTGEEAFRSLSFLVARNTAVANLLDRCAITLPSHVAGEPPVGLMLIGPPLSDRRLLAAARCVEAILAAHLGRA
jgi:aspartyl-tRNA(Asn)/glutamyl-tRNA(Gln) amidotransferase subunit A